MREHVTHGCPNCGNSNWNPGEACTHCGTISVEKNINPNGVEEKNRTTFDQLYAAYKSALSQEYDEKTMDYHWNNSTFFKGNPENKRAGTLFELDSFLRIMLKTNPSQLAKVDLGMWILRDLFYLFTKTTEEEAYKELVTKPSFKISVDGALDKVEKFMSRKVGESSPSYIGSLEIVYLAYQRPDIFGEVINNKASEIIRKWQQFLIDNGLNSFEDIENFRKQTRQDSE